MLQHGAGTHNGGDNWNSHQNQFQEEDHSTFSSIQTQARGSSSSLISGKPMATKVTDRKLTYFCITAQKHNIK